MLLQLDVEPFEFIQLHCLHFCWNYAWSDFFARRWFAKGFAKQAGHPRVAWTFKLMSGGWNFAIVYVWLFSHDFVTSTVPWYPALLAYGRSHQEKLTDGVVAQQNSVETSEFVSGICSALNLLFYMLVFVLMDAWKISTGSLLDQCPENLSW